jgi:predicted nucleic acid-binding protein
MIGADTTLLVHLEIAESPEHARAHAFLRREILAPRDQLAIAPQVLSEFIHVVTDQRRFQKPLTIQEAIAKSRFWWNAVEVRRVYPTAESTELFHDWLTKYSLGRKRLLDTQLASTLFTAGVRRIVSSNARDFAVFGVFDVISP